MTEHEWSESIFAASPENQEDDERTPEEIDSEEENGYGDWLDEKERGDE